MKLSELHRKIKKNGWVHIRTEGSTTFTRKKERIIRRLITERKKLVRDWRRK